MPRRLDTAPLRRALAQLERDRQAPLRVVFDVRGRMVRASLSQTSKVCGRPNCRCVQGEKHAVFQLSWTEGGRRRSAHVPADALADLRPAVDAYRELRRARADLARLSDQTLAVIDALTEALSEPPPPSGSSRAPGGRHGRP